MSNPSQPHGLQDARLPCPSPNSGSLLKLMSIELVMPSNHLILCHPLLLLPSVFPGIRVFQMSWFFPSGGQSIGVSASALVLPMNIKDWFPLELTYLISLKSKRLSRVFSNTIIQKHQFFGTQLFLQSNSHIHTWLLEKPQLWLDGPLLVMSPLFNMLSRLVINFLLRSKCLLISWLQSPSAVILEPPKIKFLTVSIVSPSICHEVMGPDAMILVFWMLNFKPTFSLSSFTLVLLHFLPWGWCHLHIWGYWNFFQQSCFLLVLHPVSILHDVLCI